VARYYKPPNNLPLWIHMTADSRLAIGAFFVILGMIILFWKFGLFQAGWIRVLEALPYLAAAILILLGAAVIYFGRKERKVEEV